VCGVWCVCGVCGAFRVCVVDAILFGCAPGVRCCDVAICRLLSSSACMEHAYDQKHASCDVRCVRAIDVHGQRPPSVTRVRLSTAAGSWLFREIDACGPSEPPGGGGRRRAAPECVPVTAPTTRCALACSADAMLGDLGMRRRCESYSIRSYADRCVYGFTYLPGGGAGAVPATTDTSLLPECHGLVRIKRKENYIILYINIT
jgi:hypothetical protein